MTDMEMEDIRWRKNDNKEKQQHKATGHRFDQGQICFHKHSLINVINSNHICKVNQSRCGNVALVTSFCYSNEERNKIGCW